MQLASSSAAPALQPPPPWHGRGGANPQQPCCIYCGYVATTDISAQSLLYPQCCGSSPEGVYPAEDAAFHQNQLKHMIHMPTLYCVEMLPEGQPPFASGFHAWPRQFPTDEQQPPGRVAAVGTGHCETEEKDSSKKRRRRLADVDVDVDTGAAAAKDGENYLGYSTRPQQSPRVRKRRNMLPPRTLVPALQKQVQSQLIQQLNKICENRDAPPLAMTHPEKLVLFAHSLNVQDSSTPYSLAQQVATYLEEMDEYQMNFAFMLRRELIESGSGSGAGSSSSSRAEFADLFGTMFAEVDTAAWDAFHLLHGINSTVKQARKAAGGRTAKLRDELADLAATTASSSSSSKEAGGYSLTKEDAATYAALQVELSNQLHSFLPGTSEEERTAALQSIILKRMGTVHAGAGVSEAAVPSLKVTASQAAGAGQGRQGKGEGEGRG